MLDVVEGDSDGFGSFLDGLSSKKKSKMKRRFSDEQIKSLEKIFECESKLEPRKKLQLAKDLGLQPRQVAIWFQNKRARWKSKQLERDYDVLKDKYDSLSSRFDLLNKENQSLVIQLKKLHKQMEKNGVEDARSGSMGENFDNLNSSSHEYTPSGLAMASDDDNSIKAEYFGMEDERLVAEMVEQVDGSLTSTTENWEDLDSDPLLDQSTVTDDGNQWWDFWS